MKPHFLRICALCGALLTLFPGEKAACAAPAEADNSNSRSIVLAPVRDPWSKAELRFKDIADTPFSDAFARDFSYRNARVVFTYDAAPQTDFLSGTLVARGLKPNFAYQIKLAGKPVFGSRGWGGAGDDWSNEVLGRAGRWWNDAENSTNTNNSDADFERLYKDVPDAEKTTVYGYLFVGNMVTDQNGDATRDFTTQASYHVTWQDAQYGIKDVIAGDYIVQSAAPFYGYGAPITPQIVRLWHEFEAGRAQPVRLPPGDYNCRLLLTEATFHNAISTAKGGFWPTVLGSEDLDSNGQSDQNTENDVRFRIAAAP